MTAYQLTRLVMFVLDTIIVTLTGALATNVSRAAAVCILCSYNILPGDFYWELSPVCNRQLLSVRDSRGDGVDTQMCLIQVTQIY